MALEEYRKKIANLSINEQKLRDLYLRDLALGKIQGPPTGYASLDKPWLKYYSEENIMSEISDKSCYDVLVDSCNKHPDLYAVEYLGKKITYKELLKNVDKTANAFLNLGVKEGDIVSFLVVNAPEVVYAFYALNKIGAIPNMIDLRSNTKALVNYLNEVKSKYVVAIDVCLPALYDAVPETSVDKVILLSPTNSATLPIKLIGKMGNSKQRKLVKGNEHYIDWEVFYNQDKIKGISEKFDSKSTDPAAIVHTGGTTGIPKGVILSNYNFNAVVSQVVNSPIDMKEKDKFLNVLVPFVAYGLALGMHAPMSIGWDSVLIPKFSPSEMPNLMAKHKPNGVMGIQTYYEPLLTSDKVDYSNVNVMLMGGMPTKEEFEIQFNQKVKDNNGHFQVSKGYSMTEASSCATCSLDNANEIGSNGVPLVKTTIAAFDPITGEEVGFNKLGEICINSPTRMLEYYSNPEATETVLKQHSDGKIWIHSGDIGYVTDKGFIYIVDRIKRMIIRSGYKVFPSEIENVFLKHPEVESCAVVGIDDEIDDKAPFAHIVLKDKDCSEERINKVTEELDGYIEKYGLPPYFKPISYKFRDSLPLTNIGKIDFVSLEKENSKGIVKTKEYKTK